MGVRMFCAEFDGVLQPTYMALRAGDVRHAIIANLAWPGGDEMAYWPQLRRNGWRVVPVRVEKIDPVYGRPVVTAYGRKVIYGH